MPNADGFETVGTQWAYREALLWILRSVWTLNGKCFQQAGDSERDTMMMMEPSFIAIQYHCLDFFPQSSLSSNAAKTETAMRVQHA